MVEGGWEFNLYHSMVKGKQEGIIFIPCYNLVGWLVGFFLFFFIFFKNFFNEVVFVLQFVTTCIYR